MNNQMETDSRSHVLPASFRDPSGVVFEHDDGVYRQVNQCYRRDYDKLMESGLYRKLVDERMLIAHQEVDGPVLEPDAMYRIVKPERIEAISYPYEWCFSQLKDAALLTLDIQLQALDMGMSLKDASAYNVQFHKGRPIFIDTLSFEAYREGRPWVAYRQFCQHFLGPLALMAKTDIRLNQLLRVYLDGIPLDLASRLLPKTTMFRLGILVHLHLHARSQKAFSGTTSDRRRTQDSRFGKVSQAGLRGILQGLCSTIKKLDWSPSGTEWAAYYQATNYSDTAFDHKKRLVAEYLNEANPESVWDLGANTGVFSRIAVEQNRHTVAFDIDPAAVEIAYRTLVGEGWEGPLPLLLDLTNPSPGLGWNCSERDSVIARAPVDCAMALALIHHIAISNNVPLERIAQFLSGLCSKLIIEFVPKADSQVQRLLSSREDIFHHYDQDNFERAFSQYFTILHSENVSGSERTLYLMERN